jgi:hypothetical protein
MRPLIKRPLFQIPKQGTTKPVALKERILLTVEGLMARKNLIPEELSVEDRKLWIWKEAKMLQKEEELTGRMPLEV